MSVHQKNFSPIGPAVWLAIRNIYMIFFVLLYRYQTKLKQKKKVFFSLKVKILQSVIKANFYKKIKLCNSGDLSKNVTYFASKISEILRILFQFLK